MYRAVRYQPSSPDAQANGQVLLPYLSVLRGSALAYLVRVYDLEDVRPDAFYPQQVVCDMQRRMAENMAHFTGDLVAIGVKSIDSIGFPSDVQTIGQALARLHQIYQAIHRNIPPEEGWTYEEVSSEVLHVTFNSPYEPFAAYGYIRALTDRFRPPDQTSMVVMGQGDDLVTFRVQISPRPRG